MRSTIAALLLAFTVAGCTQPHPSAGPYRVVATLPVGGAGHWDYVTFDRAGRRLYLSHNSRVDVVDTVSGRRVGAVTVAGFSHGVAVVPERNRGYVTVGTSSLAPGPEAHEVDVFDLRTLRVVGRITVPADPDGVIYEPSSKRVVAFTGDTHTAVVIDPAHDRIVKTVELRDAPGSAVADGRGRLYVTVATRAEVLELETTGFRVARRFAVAGCRMAVAVAVSSAENRLFVACRNRTLAVLDLYGGAVVAHVPIARHNDAAAYDPATRTVFVSTLDGTLSIVRSEGNDRYRLIESLQTPPGTRTLALDPMTHRVYLASASFAPLPLGAMRYPDPIAGTFAALVVEGPRP
jgi:DNA-binding beta-propeller fold protein YncE